MRRAWVFYDGSCGLCHFAVRFAAFRDRDGSRFRFAPLDGITARRELHEELRRACPETVIVLTPSGDVASRSDAVVYVLRRLGGRWSVLGTALSIVPRFVRDALYRRVAALRRRLFPPPEGACPVVPEDLRVRFDP